MNSVARIVKVIGITKEGYMFLQNKWYEKRGLVMKDQWKERLERNYVADLGDGWHGHYDGDLDFSCEEVKKLLSEQGLPFKEVGNRPITEISI